MPRAQGRKWSGQKQEVTGNTETLVLRYVNPVRDSCFKNFCGSCRKQTAVQSVSIEKRCLVSKDSKYEINLVISVCLYSDQSHQCDCLVKIRHPRAQTAHPISHLPSVLLGLYVFLCHLNKSH